MPKFRTEHTATQYPRTYNQKGGTCSGFAVTGAAQHLIGAHVPEQEVYDIYKTKELQDKGLSVQEFCDALQDDPLVSEDGEHALTVKSCERIFNGLANTAMARRKATVALENMGKFPHIAFVFGLRFLGNPGDPAMELDEQGFLKVPDATTHFELHAQYLVKNLEDRTFLWRYSQGGRFDAARPFLWVKNSWGRKFGGKGVFNPGEYGIWLDDFWKICHGLFQIEFADPKQFQK